MAEEIQHLMKNESLQQFAMVSEVSCILKTVVWNRRHRKKILEQKCLAGTKSQRIEINCIYLWVSSSSFHFTRIFERFCHFYDQINIYDAFKFAHFR